MVSEEPAVDAVVARRRRVDRLSRWGRRVGYSLLVVAVAAFAAGAVTRFTPGLVTVVTACLVATALTLAPGIVGGYAVKAAEREECERGSSRASRGGG